MRTKGTDISFFFFCAKKRKKEKVEKNITKEKTAHRIKTYAHAKE